MMFPRLTPLLVAVPPLLALTGTLLSGCPGEEECVTVNDCDFNSFCDEGVCRPFPAGDGDGDGDGDGNDGGPDDGGTGDGDGDVDAGPPPVIGPEGGTLTAGGATLIIPPGALSEEQALTLVDLGVSPPLPYEAYSNQYALEPAGVVFAQPVSLRLPFVGAPGDAAVFADLAPSRRLGGETSGGFITTTLSQFDVAFVSNGATFVELPDPTCPRARLVLGNTEPPAAVEVVVEVDDCHGVPMSGLSLSSSPPLGLLEGGAALDPSVALAELPLAGRRHYTALLLDMGSSSVDVLEDVKAAATRLSSELLAAPDAPTVVALYLFDGGPDLTVWQPFTDDSALLAQRIAALDTFAGTDPASSNLHKAVIDAVDLVEAALDLERAASAVGAQTTAELVVFADGPDTAARATAAAAGAALTGSPVRGRASLLSSAGFAPGALSAIFGGASVATSDSALLGRDFAWQAARGARRAGALYHLAYCTPKRAASHEVTVTFPGAASPSPASYTFGADGFAAGCDLGFLEGACAGRACGGLGCGRCDGLSGSSCEEAAGSAVCVDRCEEAAACAGIDVTIGGAAVACADAPLVRVNCEPIGQPPLCRDLRTDPEHCGDCETPCTGGSCVDAGCVYPEPDGGVPTDGGDVGDAGG